MLKEDMKYDGINGTFDYKLQIFYSICERADVLPEAYGRAFPNMLTGLAWNQYFNAGLKDQTFEQACLHMRNFFEGPGSERKNLGEWNAISLKTMIDENSDKSTTDCLQLLIGKLSQLQHGLPSDLRSNGFLTNKLVTACQAIPACQYAVADPPRELGLLISKLQSSIIAYEKQNPEHSQAYYTDRRYYGKNNNQDRSYGRT